MRFVDGRPITRRQEITPVYKVQYKSQNAFQSWVNYGSYGDEASALNVATRIRTRYFMVRVVDSHRTVLYVS